MQQATGPTKKGLRIPAEHFEKFKSMVNSISDSDLAATGSSEGENHQETLNSSQKIKFEKPGSGKGFDLPDY